MNTLEGPGHSLAAMAERAVMELDVERVRAGSWNQNECVYLERFLPPPLVESVLVPEVQRLRPEVHRAFLPGHKKSGSISYFTLREKAPIFLLCQLYKHDPEREMRELQLSYGPGDLVIFNGNKLWHGVSPLEAGGERVVLTMEYVTNPAMAPHKRAFSNLKDAFAYFGLSAVFLRRRRH